MLTSDVVLNAVISSSTASQIASRLDHETPREVLPILNELRESGRVSRVVADGDVARWSPVSADLVP